MAEAAVVREWDIREDPRELRYEEVSSTHLERTTKITDYPLALELIPTMAPPSVRDRQWHPGLFMDRPILFAGVERRCHRRRNE